LYGFDKAKTAIRASDGCIVVEGYTDVIMAHQAGYENVVAASGTALTEEQLHLIGRFTKNITTAFDMDMAGDSATRRGIERAQALGFAVKVAMPEGGKDPADVILDNPKNWEDSLASAKSVLQFYMDSVLAKHDPSTADGKREIGTFLAPIFASIASRIEQAHWVQELAKKLRVSEEDVWEEVRKAAVKAAQNIQAEVKQPLIQRPGVPRETMLQDAIVAHLAKDPTLLRIAKEQLSTLPPDDAMVQFLQKFDILDDTITYSEAGVLERLNEDHRLRLGEVLLEAEVMGQTEFSDRTLAPILVWYEKLVLERQLQNLERQLAVSDTDNSSEELLQDVQTISQRLKELL
ncbi:MAG: toprim domain-containing protein, partial [Candidatus Spechtbacterales bacterium]